MMNPLLAQHECVDWSLRDVNVETAQTQLCDYFVEGIVAYGPDGSNVNITIHWSAVIQLTKLYRNETKLIIDCEYAISREDVEIEGIELMHIQGDELDNWLDDFSKSVNWQSEVVNHLPAPNL